MNNSILKVRCIKGRNTHVSLLKSFTCQYVVSDVRSQCYKGIEVSRMNTDKRRLGVRVVVLFFSRKKDCFFFFLFVFETV